MPAPELPGGIQVEYGGMRAAISNSPMTAVILVVVMIGVAMANIVIDNRAWNTRAEAAMRNHHEWSGYDNRLAAYDRRRDQCIQLLDAAQRRRVNEEYNIGGDPLQYHCQWLGQPPVPPTIPR